ncbi:hypothetical protein HPB50_018710 [Hyalomma asiaticum]|uniref:Uncharacterized protein n=1 Tax=Hyalomma asiaticum TaxID=266040 RepID=A0ACB7RW70_HYAAI|nr:hypothetical protein HPB50_018710 [Hyalomma asiaticum]
MPPASSLLGHVELLSKGFHRTKCLEWVKEYGPVIRLRIGLKHVVIVNEYNAIKKFWNTKELLQRWSTFTGYTDTYKGRRDCPGQTFAIMEIFLMITFLLQRYHIMPEHPIELDLKDPQMELPRAINVKLRFIPRQVTSRSSRFDWTEQPLYRTNLHFHSCPAP